MDKLVMKVFKITVLFIFFISSCVSIKDDKYTYSINDKIPIDLKVELNDLNNELIKFIKEKDLSSLMSMVNIDLISEQEVKEMLDFFNSIIVGSENQKIIDEYWVRGGEIGVQNPVVSRFMTYSINHETTHEEEYVSLTEVKTPTISFLLITLYGKENGKWLLNTLYLGEYACLSENTVDYYQKSRENISNKHILNAYLNILKAKRFLKPGGPLFQYQIEDKVLVLEDSLIQVMNTEFIIPLKLSNISTNPEIFYINSQLTDKGFVPMISYTTNLDIDNVPSLQHECDSIHLIIEDEFKGITRNSKTLIYRAHDKIPSKTVKANHYGFIKSLGN